MSSQHRPASLNTVAALESRQPFDIDGFAARYGGVTVARRESDARLYSQGELSDAMYYIRHGQIRITVVSSQGKEGILGILEPGALCGEGCLLGDRPRVGSATCIVASTVARLERENILCAIRQDRDFSQFFLTFALTSVVRLRENLISQLFESSEQRLARTLLALAAPRKAGETMSAIRNIDQEDLAQMIGTTRSRVNHFMNRFRKLGYVDYDGGIIVVHKSLSDVALRDKTFGRFDETMAVAC